MIYQSKSDEQVTPGQYPVSFWNLRKTTAKGKATVKAIEAKDAAKHNVTIKEAKSAVSKGS